MVFGGSTFVFLWVVATCSVLLMPTYGDTTYKIPSWIKEMAGFWANEQISDSDFVQSLTYLIENEIISIPQIENLKTQNEKLKSELQEIKSYPNSIHAVSDNLKITLYTNKEVYGPDDTIMIFGTVSKLVSGHQVGIVISDTTGKILAMAKIKPNSDGSYGFVAQDPVFREYGEYSVNVYYGGEAFSHTTYKYNPGP